MNDLVKADQKYGLSTQGMSPGLAIMFNDALYERCKDIARNMSEARGFTPPHLLGKPHACFNVVQQSITWRLNPPAVAMSTYETPGGRIGYEGKLVQAILENSGHLEGPVRFEHIGDWSKIQGKWKEATSAKGNKYAVPGWDAKDEEGLGVKVIAKIRNEREPREFVMWLRECYPRNSTLWSLRPSQQICYTAVRAFGNVAAPGILLGVPFDSDMGGEMIDVTPSRPMREEFYAAEGKAGEAQEGDLPSPSPAPPAESSDETEEPGHYEAMQLGIKARRENKPRKCPVEIPVDYEPTWLAGWDEADAEMQAK